MRVSRYALVGDPLSGALSLFGIGGSILRGIGRRGKMKRQRGAGLVKLGVKPVAGGLGVNGGVANPIISGPGGISIGLPEIPGTEALERIRESITGRRGGLLARQPSQEPYRTPTGQLVFPSGVAVRGRRRRMNVLNPRALRRSITRVTGFARFARKTISITQRVKLKKRRRR
jgi:hypothetical protein